MGDISDITRDISGEIEKVGALEKELGAEIVVQEATSPEGYECEEEIEGYNPYGRTRNYMVTTRDGEPRIAKPDIKKRAIARDSLWWIFNHSDCYSARYAAGKVLGIKEDELRVYIEEDWRKRLERKVRSPPWSLFGKRISQMLAVADLDLLCKNHYGDSYAGRELREEIDEMKKELGIAGENP